MTTWNKLTKLFSFDVSRGRYENFGTNFMEACTPKIWEGIKRPKFGAISDNFGL